MNAIIAFLSGILSGAIGILIRIFMLVILILIIIGFPWPDISEYLLIIPLIVKKLWFLDWAINIPLVFIAAKINIAIMIFLLTKQIVIKLGHFITSGVFYSAPDPNVPGQGTWWGEL